MNEQKKLSLKKQDFFTDDRSVTSPNQYLRLMHQEFTATMVNYRTPRIQTQ